MTDWNEHEDAISDAISDSIDMDWTSRTGAKAVVAWLNENAAAPAAPQAAGVGGVDPLTVTLEWSKVETKALEEWRAEFGDYVALVTLGHDNVWAHRVNNTGSLHYKTADDAKAAALEDLRNRLSIRLHAARKAIAMYDRAPSRGPEGGVVDRRLRWAVVQMREVLSRLQFSSNAADFEESRVAGVAIGDAALATREEAPAGAGPVCLEIPLSNHMRVTLEYDPDGSRTATLWNEANEPIADGDAPSLRAQPPAREDAQPVAKIVSAHGDPEAFGEREVVALQDLKSIPYNTPLYAHPAPGSLRAVAAALKPFATAARGLSSRWADHETHWQGATSPVAVEDLRRADQALAALQAEQGAK